MKGRGPPTVLVLDDDLATRDFFRDALEMEGYRVETGDCLSEATGPLRRGSVAVVVTDGLDADRGSPDLRFLAGLRALAPDVPVILCTGRPWAWTLDAKRHGLFAIFPKPFDLDQLLVAIDQAIGSATGHANKE